MSQNVFAHRSPADRFDAALNFVMTYHSDRAVPRYATSRRQSATKMFSRRSSARPWCAIVRLTKEIHPSRESKPRLDSHQDTIIMLESSTGAIHRGAHRGCLRFGGSLFDSRGCTRTGDLGLGSARSQSFRSAAAGAGNPRDSGVEPERGSFARKSLGTCGGRYFDAHLVLSSQTQR